MPTIGLRRFNRHVLLLATVLFGGAAQPASTSSEEPYRAFTTTTVRLRSGPSTEHTILALMPRGSPVQVQQCEGDWCEVTFRRLHGYAAERYLSRLAPPEPLYTGRGYYNKDGIWVPSPTHTPDGTPPAGATARCRDGTFSFSMSRRGTCSHHGGVARWLR